MIFLRYLLVIASFFCLVSCDLDETANRRDNLPTAAGRSGEILVVMDSTFWENEVGDSLRAVFAEQVPYIPRKEPLFKLIHTAPRTFQSFLKRQKNIIFVTAVNDKNRGNKRLKRQFSRESLDMIKDDPELYMFSKKDDFAKGQEILHIFGQDKETLIHNLSKNKRQLQQHFIDIEAKRLNRALFGVKYEQGLSNRIGSKLGCEIKLPLGFEVGIEDENFVWLRDFSPDIDKSIFIAWLDYSSEEMFSMDSLLRIRTEISKPYILYKPEDKESYLLTETDNFDVFRQEINFKGNYAVELKGLWKVNKYYMGGPFVSYSLVNQATNRFYYIEAFLFSPGKPQRDIMRELEAILKTFNLAESPVNG